MSGINQNTPVEEVAALISQALEAAGVDATLSGGGAVPIYNANAYQRQWVRDGSAGHVKKPTRAGADS